jgi:hypothetical protein
MSIALLLSAVSAAELVCHSLALQGFPDMLS